MGGHQHYNIMSFTFESCSVYFKLKKLTKQKKCGKGSDQIFQHPRSITHRKSVGYRCPICQTCDIGFPGQHRVLQLIA